MKYCNILFLLLMPSLLIAQGENSESVSSVTTDPISISIRPDSKSGSLNIRSQICPNENFDFRTCEGVLSGSNVMDDLFLVQLPPVPGDGNKSWKKQDDTWSYTWPYEEGITVNVKVEPASDGLKLTYTLENTTTRAMDDVQLHPCIPTTEAPGFFPEPTFRNGDKSWSDLYERLSLWSDGKRFSFSEAKLAESEPHLAFMYQGVAPINWAWWINGSETFNLPLITLTSRDGHHTVALAFEQAIWASANVGDERACFHLFPWFGRIEPGESVSVNGRFYILEGGPKEAIDRFQKDFQK